ncbi:MAG TPA: MFS transporter [Gemmatimonadales bacterium]|nr:MFS transporter [Gemmatimonadales bacterium]
MTEAERIERSMALGALSHRNFRLFFFGQGISLIGTWMQSVALGWLVLELTNSAFAVGVNQALRSLGVLVFTLYGGTVVDRVDKRRLIVWTQVLQMLEALALAALVWTHTVAIWQVMVLAVMFGIVNAFDIPARQAFIVELVGKDDLMNAIALNSSMFNAARIVGPAVAGLLIGASGVAMCFFLNGISYIAVLGGLAAMRLPTFVPRTGHPSAWEGFREALGFIRSERRMSALVTLVAIFSVLGFPFLVLMPVVARDVLHTNARGYGLLMTSVGVGAMLGALALAWRGRSVRKGMALLVSGGAFGALLVAFAATRSYVVAVLLLALAGCAMIVTTALSNTMIQLLVPDALRGRVMAFYAFVFVGMAPFGAFQAGFLAEHYGTPLAIGLGGVGCLVAVLVAAWRAPALRTMD